METSESVIVGAVWVCTDCYMAHHYGTDDRYVEFSDEWDRDTYEMKAAEMDLTDWSCDPDLIGDDEIENGRREFSWQGRREFSWQSCDLCESRLGGSRYRLAVWDRND